MLFVGGRDVRCRITAQGWPTNGVSFFKLSSAFASIESCETCWCRFGLVVELPFAELLACLEQDFFKTVGKNILQGVRSCDDWYDCEQPSFSDQGATAKSAQNKLVIGTLIHAEVAGLRHRLIWASLRTLLQSHDQELFRAIQIGFRAGLSCRWDGSALLVSSALPEPEIHVHVARVVAPFIRFGRCIRRAPDSSKNVFLFDSVSDKHWWILGSQMAEDAFRGKSD